MRQDWKKTGGFTLIELLVVIGIIVLLISILLPALGAARRQARIAETTAELTGLSHDIDLYFTQFNAYPGPASYLNTTSATSGQKLSGNQNLLIGLSFSMASTVTPLVGIPGGKSVSPTSPTGPQDLAVQDSPGVYRQYTPFYSPAGRELSAATSATPAWPSAGVTGAIITANTFQFPVILDRFPEALPILYYRKNAGVDTPIAISAAGSNNCAYNYMDNIEYTTATALKTSTGTVYNQTTVAPVAVFDLAALTSLATSTGTTNARGGYILISAGPDRYYGAVSGKSDNIVVVGGQ